MHIPDNYLSPQTCAVMTAVMVPVWMISINKVKDELPKEKAPMMGASSALSFLAMMFNIPLPGGTTGHAVGGTLAAMVLGPHAACLTVTIALLVQALLFGDGGILSFGANCFNMAFVLPFTGYAVYRILIRLTGGKSAGEEPGPGRRLIAGAAGSYIGLNAAALVAAIEFGIQPMLFRNASGEAMYCPYDLSVSIPAMMIGHLTVFGLAEVVFTVMVAAFLMKTQPSLFARAAGDVSSSGRKKAGARSLDLFLGVLIAATPLGLLAEGTAWGEWSADEITALTGSTPQGMRDGFEFSGLLPDYSVSGLPGWFGYLVSALIGTAILIIAFKLIAASLSKRRENVTA